MPFEFHAYFNECDHKYDKMLSTGTYSIHTRTAAYLVLALSLTYLTIDCIVADDGCLCIRTVISSIFHLLELDWRMHHSTHTIIRIPHQHQQRISITLGIDELNVYAIVYKRIHWPHSHTTRTRFDCEFVSLNI